MSPVSSIRAACSGARRHRRPCARSRHATLLVVLAAALAAGCAVDDAPAELPADEPPTSVATSELAAVTPWLIDGLDPEYDARGERVLFMRAGADGYTDIWETDADGGGAVCRTCDLPISARGHVGNPRPTPDGNWVIFSAEKAEYPHKAETARCKLLAHPGVGLMNDLYVADRQFTSYRLLHGLSVDPTARTCDDQHSLYAPQLSAAGTRIGWSETVVTLADDGEFGEYRIWIADLIAGSPPTLGGAVAVNPGAESGWREFGGFLPGSNDVIVGTGDIAVGQDPKFGSAFRYNLRTGATIDLTPFPLTSWDETVHPNADGSLLAWHSSRELDGAAGCLVFRLGCASNARTEYWIMGPFGGAKQRLTHFNDPTSPEFTGENTIATNLAWQPGATDRGLVSVLLLPSRQQRIYRFQLR